MSAEWTSLPHRLMVCACWLQLCPDLSQVGQGTVVGSPGHSNQN